MNPARFAYKSHVDGLRAIAVVLVVLFHVGIPGIHGGFIGVDVFFVISGYLITSLLLIEAEESGGVNLLDFYARRVRRLFPALLLVVLATLLLGFIFLLPIFQEQSGLAKSAIATSLYLSNFYFWKYTGDYFDGPTDFEPLLHTWSLAVEEQFYLVWPLLVIAVAKFFSRRGGDLRRNLLIGLLVFSTLSFALNLWATSTHPMMAFYFMPTRAWQFGMGGVLALWLATQPQVNSLVAKVIAIAGFIAVLAGGLLLTERGFPGMWALIPTLGTVAIIGGNCLQPGNPIARLLSTVSFRFIGLVSYAWYLWHWPLLAIARVSSLQRDDLGRDVLLGVLSFVLAVLTYWWVETPTRVRRPWFFKTTRGTLISGAVISVATIAAAFALSFSARHAANSDPRLIAANHARYDVHPRRDTCNHPLSATFRGLPPAKECTSGNPDRIQAVLWGDSHAEHLSGLVEAYGALNPQTGVLRRTMSSCRPYGDDPSTAMVEACQDFYRAVEQEVTHLKEQGLSGIIISSMWVSVFRDPSMRNLSNNQISPEYYAASEMKFDALVTRLEKTGLRVLIIGPFHLLPHEVPQCLARHSEADCGADRSSLERQRKLSIDMLQRVVAKHPGGLVRLWDPLEAVCNKVSCPPVQNGVVMYNDAWHLSASGSRLLMSAARAELDWVVGADGR